MQVFGLRENFAFAEKPLKESRDPLPGRIFTKLETSYWDSGSMTIHSPHDLAGEIEVVARLDANVTRSLTLEQALALPLSYAVGIDFGSGSKGREDGQWWRSKGARGYAPVGKFVSQNLVGDLRRQVLDVMVDANVQSIPLDGMENGASEAITQISNHCDLRKGDLIFLGALCFVRGFDRPKEIAVSSATLPGIELHSTPIGEEYVHLTMIEQSDDN